MHILDKSVSTDRTENIQGAARKQSLFENFALAAFFCYNLLNAAIL